MDDAWTARENLTDVLERELLGPAGGPEEVLDGAPDAAYLVGRIAPVRLTGRGDPGSADDPDADLGDDVAATEGRGVPQLAVDDSGATADEDAAIEDQPQQRGLMIPASMGLRCQVPDDLDTITVTGSWGVYRPVRDETDDGRRSRRYQRTPVTVTRELKLAGLVPGTTHDETLVDHVTLRVDVHHDEQHRRRYVELALCNDRVTPPRIPVDAWMYQTRLEVDAGGAAAFLPVTDVREETWAGDDHEQRRLDLQYRDRLEFALGRTCSADWEVAPKARRATRVWTTWLPTVETPQTTADEIEAAELDMRVLADAGPDALDAGLRPIVAEYTSWLDAQQQEADALPAHLRDEADEAVHEARKVADQLRTGLDHLLADDEALRCFRFMNRVMADQRVQTQVAGIRARRPDVSLAEARSEVLGGPHPHSWRTFQLAFILMQLPMLTEPAAPRRSGDLAKAQLLFFPTGGGKTEAYLGLAAYAFAARRRQGLLDTSDGPLDGRAGVTVLMRYTLRLLTSQQFQRATALVCAAELARAEDPGTWGDEPFRIGLWVGTDVSPKRYDEAKEQLSKANDGRDHRLTVLQIRHCPWCGSPVEGRDIDADEVARRIRVRCGDETGACPFAEGGDVADGLPVLTVDEEIYRLAPAFVIATVDKFARLAREGEAAALFGYVARRCERHGYVHPDYPSCNVGENGVHHAKASVPAARVRPVPRLRPPDLVIQDELHLITGALGTTVGLFEAAIDVMTSWSDASGRPVRPLLVASTATARNATDQVRALYARDVTIFPPQVLDAGRTFFSREEPVTEATPGRRYVGVSTTGVRLTAAEIRVSEILMAGGQAVLDAATADDVADPYLTLVAYFNAIRELAGMARYLPDDVETALRKPRPWTALPHRYGTDYGHLNVAELTSRIGSADITSTLDRMAVPFSRRFDSVDGRRQLAADRRDGRTVPARDERPYDAVLATSMLQVGVDVTRLGLMLVVGQPKNTAEYIQASSRVGRDARRPGLVVTLGNWARPRDQAHFEGFRHYHETFYAQVEALSVTPYSITSIDRGLDGALVSAARVLQAVRPAGQGLSPETGADAVDAERAFVETVVERLVARVLAAADEDAATLTERRLRNRLDQWSKRRGHLAGQHRALVYERVTAKNEGSRGSLMTGPENARAHPDGPDVPPFVVPNSMREVQPEINLLVSPDKERLWSAPASALAWRARGETGE